MNLLVLKIQTGGSFFLAVIYFWNSKTISQLNFEPLLVTDFCSNDFCEIPLAYLLYQLKPIPEISVKNISNFFYQTRFSFNSTVLLSANFSRNVYHQWNRNILYYCRMIAVVLCKVSQPSRYNRKSYDGNFVPAKCSGINYGATLISHFDTINGFSGSGRDSGWIEVFEKVLTSSPLLFSRRFSLVWFSIARPPFLFVSTDREPGTG